MKRKLRFLFIFLFIVAISLMVKNTLSKLRSKEESVAKRKEMPTIQICKLDSSLWTINNLIKHRTTVILFFDPECEHCEYEVKEFKKNASDLINVDVFMLSSSNISKIKYFSIRNELNYYPFYCFKITHEEINKTFGFIYSPHIFIYRTGKLLKEFRGETKFFAIKKFLE